MPPAALREIAAVADDAAIAAAAPTPDAAAAAAAVAADVPGVVVFADELRAAVMGAVLDLMGAAVKPVALVGPRGAGLDRLGKALDLPPRDDLRRALIEHPGATLFAASLADLAPAELDPALRKGGRVLTLGPVSTTFEELAAWNDSPRRGQGDVVSVPAFLDGPGMAAAAEPRAHLGTPRLVAVSSLGRPEHGPLLGRLLDAWHTALAFTDLPEAVDAALFPAAPTLGAEAPPRRIAGHLAAHARLPAGGSVTLALSDRAAATTRHLDLLGDAAHLRVTDATFTLLHPDGSPVDQGPTPARPVPIAAGHLPRPRRPPLARPAAPPRRRRPA